jgi:hypothetical protein
MHNKTLEYLPNERNTPGVDEHDDDTSGEFEHVNMCQCDKAGSEGPGKSSGTATTSTGTFEPPPSLAEARSALDALKYMLCLPHTSHTEHSGYKDPKLDP